MNPHSLFVHLPKNVQCVVRPAGQLSFFAGGEMVPQIDVKRPVVHPVDGFPHMIGETVRRHKMQRREGKRRPERVDIRFTV